MCYAWIENKRTDGINNKDKNIITTLMACEHTMFSVLVAVRTQ